MRKWERNSRALPAGMSKIQWTEENPEKRNRHGETDNTKSVGTIKNNKTHEEYIKTTGRLKLWMEEGNMDRTADTNQEGDKEWENKYENKQMQYKVARYRRCPNPRIMRSIYLSIFSSEIVLRMGRHGWNIVQWRIWWRTINKSSGIRKAQKIGKNDENKRVAKVWGLHHHQNWWKEGRRRGRIKMLQKFECYDWEITRMRSESDERISSLISPAIIDIPLFVQCRFQSFHY